MEFIHNFKIIQKLGAGGQGEVYLAKHSKHKFKFDRLVALKIVNKTSSTIEEFSNEVEILAKLHHPKICQIYDVGEIENSYFFVMEYIEGLSLNDFIAESEKKKIEIGCSELLEVLDSILSALKYAHQAEPSPILHRDICPKNIMISKSGEVVLIDFGISDILKPISENYIKGKPSYLPIKILNGEEVYSVKTELYSVGVVLFEAVTGKKLYNENELDLEKIEDDRIKTIIRLLIRFDGNYDEIFKATEEVLQSDRSNLRGKSQKIFNRRIIAEKTQQIRAQIQSKIPFLGTKKNYRFLIIPIFILSGFSVTKTSVWNSITSQNTPLSIYTGKFMKIKPLSNEMGIEFNEQVATTLKIKNKYILRTEIHENGCKEKFKWLAHRRDEAVVEFTKINVVSLKPTDSKCYQMPKKKEIAVSATIELRKDGNYLYIRKLSGSSEYIDKEEKYQKTR